jgi:hypothetical protein
VVILALFPYYRGGLMMGGDVLVEIFDTYRCVSGCNWSNVTFCLPTRISVLNIKNTIAPSLFFYFLFLALVFWVFSLATFFFLR